MSTPIQRRVLVVCSDDRATDLALALADYFSVFRREWVQDTDEWAWSRWDRTDWIMSEETPELTKISVLFFHTGQSDPAGIPESRQFDKEFAFSGGGLAATSPAGRTQAVPIQRRFEAGTCPIKPRHLPELIAFVEGSRKEPPSFCKPEEAVPGLCAIAILCQGYAAASMIEGKWEVDPKIPEEVGWTALSSVTKVGLAPRLGPLSRNMKSLEWWQKSLGLFSDDGKMLDDKKHSKFLSQLLQDLDLDSLAAKHFELSEPQVLSDRKSRELLGFLRLQHGKGATLGDLLFEQEIAPQSVADAYRTLRELLDQR